MASSNGVSFYLLVASIILSCLCAIQTSTHARSQRIYQRALEAHHDVHVSCTESEPLSDEAYAEYEDSGDVMKRHLGSIAAYSGYRSHFNRPNSYNVVSNNDNYKFKRFLGSLARGGWFPRQFRGFVQPGTGFQKRHIGSVARTGWLPYGRSREQDYQ